MQKERLGKKTKGGDKKPAAMEHLVDLRSRHARRALDNAPRLE